MRKIARGVMALLMLLTLSTQPLKAETETKTHTTAVITQHEADALIERLHEIQKMDKSTMSKEERKELRSEVISIKERLQEHPTVIYISGGVILLIILLLLLL